MSSATWSWPDAEVVRIIDGDTLDMRVVRDMGFGGTASFVVRLRLNRVNAPGGSTASGKLATAALQVLLPVGGKFALETIDPYKFGGPRTSPGEWMAEIAVPGGNASDAMVAGSHAVYWDGQGPRPSDG